MTTKYQPITKSILELADEIERGEVFHRVGEDYIALTGETPIKEAIYYNQFYLRVDDQADWQHEVCEFLGGSPVQGDKMSKELIRYLNQDWDFMSCEDFLEMCRVALRATGELK